MKFFRRWTSGIISSVDSVVAKIENHEALINSAISDFQKNMSRAQVQLRTVKKDGDSLRARLKEEQKAQKTWKERAIRSAEDEEGALECLRRSKSAARMGLELEQRLEEHTRTEAKLVKDLSKLRDGLSELKEQRNLMRTRQSRAKAMVAISDGQGRMKGDIEEILERWEIHVAGHEIEGGCVVDEVDRLEASYEEEEEKEELLAELERLREEHV